VGAVSQGVVATLNQGVETTLAPALALALVLAMATASCGGAKPASAPAPNATAPSASAPPPKPPREPPSNEARRKQIYDRLHAKRDDYRACFRTAHAEHNEIDYVNVTVVVTLKPSGEIVSITRKEGTPDEQATMIDCINAAVRSIAFPPHPKGKETTIRYPLTFSSGK
jgi:hypothetical protein